MILATLSKVVHVLHVVQKEENGQKKLNAGSYLFPLSKILFLVKIHYILRFWGKKCKYNP